MGDQINCKITECSSLKQSLDEKSLEFEYLSKSTKIKDEQLILNLREAEEKNKLIEGLNLDIKLKENYLAQIIEKKDHEISDLRDKYQHETDDNNKNLKEKMTNLEKELDRMMQENGVLSTKLSAKIK
ncbi:hypothetical protein MXB_1842, partial [Myxobolus squamalis]